MTTNRLAKSTTTTELKFTAAEWAAIAHEKGHAEASRKWDERAADLGEQRLPYGMTVRFKDKETVERVWTAQPAPKSGPLLDRRGEAMSNADTAELNTILASLGATARYRADGSRYSVTV